MDYVKETKEIFEKAFAQYGDDTRSCLWERPMIMRYEELKKNYSRKFRGKKYTRNWMWARRIV